MRYVVVGLGNIGRRRRALLSERCVATVDPFAPDADHAALEEVDPKLYDAVVLAVPSDAKLALLERCLALGKHALVEKPLALPDRAALARLERRAAQAHACWYTSYNHRFEPLIERLRRLYAEGAIGQVYYARLVYANGTVAHVRGTWRDRGLGVIEDLACHLFDLVKHLFGERPAFRLWSSQRNEAESPDRAVIGSSDGRVTLDVSYLSWKNHFAIELIGEKGSLHLDGLRKWGSCRLTRRERIFPSGVPLETHWEDSGEDVAWGLDVAEFERRAAVGVTSAESDWWISECLHRCQQDLAA